MIRPMEGVRILEVAQFTFVPAAGAVLADWGAEVIKVEHAEHGDAQRGLSRLMDMPVGAGSFAPLMEHPNRGKRSIGLALERPEALQVLHELIASSDVFLTNFLPAARRRLGIELEDVRAVNPDIIYVRGSGFGNAGPDSEKGGYDSTAFWARGGSALGTTPIEFDGLCKMPAGAYGDSLGGMTIAGGIAAALLARERTGETSVVDVSLLGVGAWANALSVGFALLEGGPQPERKPSSGSAANQSAGRPLPHRRQSVARVGNAAAGPVLARILPAHRARGPPHRRTVRKGRGTDGQRGGGSQWSFRRCLAAGRWPSGPRSSPAWKGNGPSRRTRGRWARTRRCAPTE